MWEPSNLIEKKFQDETNRFVGEEKLHELGNFIDEYTQLTNKSLRKFGKFLNITAKPIFIDEKANEAVSVLHLAHSDNNTLSRILSTLGGICQEIEWLKQEAETLYPAFLFYGEEIGKTTDNFERISEIIETLQKTHSLVKRTRDVTALTLRQLSGILNKGYYVSDSTSSFPEILSLFADLLICLVKFDTVLDEKLLRNHWLQYKRYLRNFMHKCPKLGFEVNELQAFNDTLAVLENSLLSGAIFKDTIETCLESKLIVDIKNSSLNIEFYNFLSSHLSELEKNEDNILYMDMFLQLNILVAFYFNIFGISDKKFTKRLLDLNKKISACTLIGNISWYPEQFLIRHVQSLAKFIDEKNIESYRLNQINSRVQNLPKETNILCLQACYFLIDLENKTKVNVTSLKVRQLKEISVLLLDGLKLMRKINWIIKWIMNIHLDKNLPVSKTILTCISRLVEILKGIYESFFRHMLLINYFLLLISQHLQHTALSHLTVLKKNHTQTKSYKDQQLDILSAIKVCENALKGNAMGYVRLIRSGGNRCLAEGTCFIPDLTQTELLCELSENEQLSEMSSGAVDVLSKDLKNFTENFENTTEYFKLLVKAFLNHFRNPNNMHLRNFYIIVPPLTINFVERSLTCKERLYKKDKADSAFTDDGFALGLAYIIELLDQESQLNSIHWFESVQRKFSIDKQKIREQMLASNSEDTKLKQTSTLTEKRLNSFQREFKLLEYSYSSARLFFQS